MLYNSIWVIEDTKISHFITNEPNSFKQGENTITISPIDFIKSVIKEIKSNLTHLFFISINSEIKESLDLVKEIKSLTPNYKFQIIIISSVLDGIQTKDCHSLGVNEIITDLTLKDEIRGLIEKIKKEGSNTSFKREEL